MADHEQISIIVGQLQGLLSRADKMSKNGLDLSKQKIASAVEDGVHKDFIRIIEKAREINDRNGLGQHGELLSLANPEIGNWSDLIDKCIIILPILKAIQRRLSKTDRKDKRVDNKRRLRSRYNNSKIKT